MKYRKKPVVIEATQYIYPASDALKEFMLRCCCGLVFPDVSKNFIKERAFFARS